MKKLTALMLTAAMAFSLSSCSSEKPIISDSEPVEELTEDEGLPVYGELNPEDFKEINVNISFLDEGSPLTLKKYDLSDLRFEPKRSPCTAEAVREKYLRGSDLCSISFNNEMTEEEKDAIRREIEKNSTDRLRALCDTDYEGCVDSSCTLVGDELYFFVNYDRLCDYSHCFEVKSVNIKTKELKTLYSYSGLSSEYKLYNMECGGEKLWLCMSVHDETYVEGNDYNRNTYVYSLDLASGAFEQVALPEELNEYKDAWFTTEYSLMLTIRTFDDDYSETSYRFYEYDEETDSWNEIDDDNSKGNSFFRFNGAEFVASGKNEDRTSFAECERFRLNTGLKSANMYDATKKRLAFLQSDTMVDILYVYDLEKMERYRLDLTSKTSYPGMIFIGEELMIYDSKGSAPIYLMPEYGIAYKYENDKFGYLRKNNDTVYFALVNWTDQSPEVETVDLGNGVTEYITIEPQRTPIEEICTFEPE